MKPRWKQLEQEVFELSNKLQQTEADLAAARALLQEARDNAYASIAEEGISQMRYEYRKELVERINAALNPSPKKDNS